MSRQKYGEVRVHYALWLYLYIYQGYSMCIFKRAPFILNCMSHKYDNNKQRLTGNLKIQNVYFPTFFFSFVENVCKMNTSFKVHVVNIKKAYTYKDFI